MKPESGPFTNGDLKNIFITTEFWCRVVVVVVVLAYISNPTKW